MRKLIKFKDGQTYVVGGGLEIYPNIPPVEEFNLEGLKEEEFKKIQENPKNKTLIKKIERLNGESNK